MSTLFNKDNKAESWPIAMLLAVVGGYLDIYCYLARGKVFANTQTGNLVLLGFNIAERNFPKVIYYLLSIVAFLIGVGISKLIEYKFKVRKYIDWLHIILIIEMVALMMVMFIPQGKFNIFANMTVSFVCGLQVQGFKKVEGKAYSTIMFTGNLRSLADYFIQFLFTKNKEILKESIIYLGVILAFITGGWIGTFTTKAYGIKAVGFITIVLLLVFVELYLDRKKRVIRY